MEQTRLTRLIAWVIATVLGATVGWLAFSSIFGIPLLHVLEVGGGKSFAAIVASAILTELVVGLAQAFALYGSSIRSQEWLAATFAGWLLGLLVGGIAIVPLTLLFGTFGLLIPMPPEYKGCGDDCQLAYAVAMYIFGFIGALSVAWILMGLVIGSVQAFVLRKRLGRSTWWVRATVAGWIPGALMCAVVTITSNLSPLHDESQLTGVAWLLGVTVYGLIYGVATGIPLEHLLRVGYSSHL